MRNDSPAARDFSGELENAPATNSILPSSSAAVRCTGPINAPGPPPANPMRSFRFSAMQFPSQPRSSTTQTEPVDIVPIQDTLRSPGVFPQGISPPGAGATRFPPASEHSPANPTRSRAPEESQTA